MYFDDELKDLYDKSVKILGFDVPQYVKYQKSIEHLDDYPRTELQKIWSYQDLYLVFRHAYFLHIADIDEFNKIYG